MVPFAAVGTAGIVAGGISAAVTGPTGWERGSWVAAFLVLVVGVGQIGLGVGQALIAEHEPSGPRVTLEAVLLNLGAVLVVTGTLASVPMLVSAGSLGFAGALVAFALFAWGPQARHRWLGAAYVTLLLVLIVSTPIGIALSWTRR